MTRKYISDYKYTETINDKGRIKTQAVYIGDHYCFKDADKAGKTGHTLFILCCFAWCAFIAAMIPRSGAAHLMYVILPYAFAALPLGYLTATAYRINRAKEVFIHSEADKMSDRLPISALWGSILTVIPLIGEIVTAFAAPEKMMRTDILFSILCGVVAAVFIYGFTRRSTVKVQRINK